MSDKKQEVFKAEKRFYSDIPADLHGVFLRATIYCGEILSLTVPELPEGYSFFSAKDIPKDKTVTVGENEIPLFAENRVSFFGQPMGILVGEDKFTLQSLLQEFKIEYKEEPLVYFPAVKEQAEPNSRIEIPDFHSNDFVLQKEKISGDEKILEECLKEERECHYSLTLPENYSERIGCIASYKKGSIHIYAPIRWLSLTAELIEKVTGLPGKKIILHSTVCHRLPTNSLFEIPILCAQMAVAALGTKGTVKFESSGFEHSAFFARNMNAIAGIKSAVDENGKIRGMKFYLIIDIGYFNPCINTILSRILPETCGSFEIPNYHIQIFTQNTNYSSSNVSPRRLSALITMALNRHFHEKSLDFGTENFFLKNAILCPHEKMECEKLPTIFAKVLDQSDYKRKNSAYKNLTSMNDLTLPIRGISFALGFENSGGFDSADGKNFYTMEVTMAADNNVIIKFHRIKDEIKMAWRKLAADFFNLQPSQIVFDETFTEKNFSLTCEIFPQDLAITTQLLLKCCAAIKKSRFINPLPIRVKKSYSGASKAFFSTAWCVAVCEVELDTVLLEPMLRHLWLGIDAGNVLVEKHFTEKTILQAKKMFKHLIKWELTSEPKIDITMLPTTASEKSKDVSMLIDGVLAAAIANAFSEALNVRINSLPLDINDILREKFTAKVEVSPKVATEVAEE